jgi:hypothetical protein
VQRNPFVAYDRRVFPRITEPVFNWVCDAWERSVPARPQDDWSRWERVVVWLWGVPIGVLDKLPFQRRERMPMFEGADRWEGY